VWELEVLPQKFSFAKNFGQNFKKLGKEASAFLTKPIKLYFLYCVTKKTQ